MKPCTSLFVILHSLGLAAAASIASPDAIVQNLEVRHCYPAGEKYGIERGEAFAAARKACNGPLQGLYKRCEVRSRCYNIGPYKHVKFTMLLEDSNKNGALSLSKDECFKLLSRKISNCERGGMPILMGINARVGMGHAKGIP
ncbi:unnamed protein product [Clonostachys solani]|uniref:Secreted protein n=1 Tax=Clonostachys solani TaxID=160281 RepID=A0A9N9W534_9HYPO|nr:unnamed protein product [Clonostachys solani]